MAEWFLSKRPDLLHMSVTPDNGWFGVTVTSSKEKQRIDQLRENVGSTHLHVTFEPMFNDIGEVDLHGISWIVIGTETGKRKGKAVSEVSWVENLTEQAHHHAVHPRRASRPATALRRHLQAQAP